MENYLARKLPINMKNQLWIDFFNCLQEEFKLVKEEIEKKKYLYDIENMDYERMLEIVSLFEIPFNISIDNRESFLRNEIKSLPFRLKNKATVGLFRSLIKRMERRGDVFTYYYDGEILTKNISSILKTSSSITPRQVYYIESALNFSSYVENQIKLDEGRKLDDEISWSLDNASVRKATKHLSLEIFLDELFFSGLEGSAPNAGGYPSVGLAPSKILPPSKTLSPTPKIAYLIAKEYFEYIESNANAFRKTTDVIKVGCQLNAFADNSRFFNSEANLDYTIPTIRLNAVTTDFIENVLTVEDITHIEFGCGYNKNLPSYDGVGTQPTQLKDFVARYEISKKEENTDWYGVVGEYLAFQVNDFIIETPIEGKTSFSTSLPKYPIKPFNVEISFMSGIAEYIIKDDGFGNLISNVASGTIDYNNGNLSFSTIVDSEKSFDFSNLISNVFDYTVDFDLRPILTSTLIVRYIISDTTYVAKSDYNGDIVGTGCVGTVNVVAGEIHLEFLDIPESLNLRFKTRKTTYPKINEPIKASFFSNKSDFYIQEVGLKNSNDELIAYSCFPRIGFDSFRNYLSFGFLIKKSNF
jgi:hypothetical protein